MEVFRKGILNVRKNTLLKGRWEKVSNKPLIIADVGHNEEGFKEVIYEIKKIKSQRKIFVLGFVKDKPIKKIIKLFPKEGIYFFSSPKISFIASQSLVPLLSKSKSTKFKRSNPSP